MLWQKGRRSDNVQIDPGGGGRFGGGRGLGLGGLVLLAILGLVFYKDPTALLGQLDEGGPLAPSGQSSPSTAAEAGLDPQQVDFVRAILGDTEDTWQAIFASRNRAYAPPKLVLFQGQVRTACGSASSAVGPFYCPGDQKVYLDLDFFEQMQRRFQASGDFARAYVIAHEVGHHVQNLMGVSEQVERARQQGANLSGAGGLSVRQELQADCFAGVWANHAEQRLHWLQAGDVEGALSAASAIGDDALQRQAQGTVVPDAFTHGSSAQRVEWFRRGLESGDPVRCDTFNGSL